MRTLFALIRLVRPHNAAAAALSAAAGHLLAGGSWPPAALLWGTALVTAAGNVINDVYDRDIDLINKPGRPLPSGAATPRAAIVLYALLLAGAAGTALLLPVSAAAWLLSWALLLHLYSARLKRVFVAGNLLVAAVSASGFLLGALLAGRLVAGAAPACFTFAFVLARELVKDCEDEAGDAACGARTVPIVSGHRRALGLATILLAFLALLFPLPFVLGVYGPWYAVVVLAGLEPVLFTAIALVGRGRRLGLASLILKAGMFVGILAFLLA